MTIKMWRRGEGGNLRKGRGDGEGANGKGEAFHLVLDMPHICIIGSNPSFLPGQYICGTPITRYETYLIQCETLIPG